MRHITDHYGTLLLAVTLEPREVGKRIAAARNRKGWTQLDFALEASVSPSSVQRWEGGKLPPIRELMRIADLLEISAADLVEMEVPTHDADLGEILDRLDRNHDEVLKRLSGIEEQIRATAATSPRQARQTNA